LKSSKNRDAEDEYLCQQHGRAAPGCDENLNKSVGHEVSDDVVLRGNGDTETKSCKLVQLC
jgi:hypothetical protein